MTRPRAIGWYHGLCWLLAAANLGLLALGIWMIASAESLQNENVTAGVIRLAGIAAAVTGAIFGFLNAAVTRLPVRPWAWTLHLTNILAAMVFICPLPLCIPLLVAWCKPEVRAYFGAGEQDNR